MRASLSDVSSVLIPSAYTQPKAFRHFEAGGLISFALPIGPSTPVRP
jgi:hypothetical protein